MEVKFNVTGARRKMMVGVISDIIEVRSVYMGMPTAAYTIDFFTVSRDSTLIFDDRSDSEIVEKVLKGLEQAGFEFKPSADEEEENAQESDTKGLTVEIPLEAVQVGNLTKILEGKGSLIKKALGINDLRFEVKDNRISFPWFSEVEPDEATAYSHFISVLCEMAKNQKRITAKEKETDNDKYAFRCFLLRLGFIGEEFKTERKILLRNLTGSSAFKGGAKNAVSQ